MVDHHSLWDRAIAGLIGQTMDKVLGAMKTDHAITILVFGSKPFLATSFGFFCP
jgi:hypothetical protein